MMAGTTGLEPATSAVTGQRSNQLSYVPRLSCDNVVKSLIEQQLANFACTPILYLSLNQRESVTNRSDSIFRRLIESTR
jgi:hypothetical protein